MDRNKINSVYLAEEIMEDILSRLPVKSLLRFRCVSKSWLSLISSQRFMKTHLDNSTKNRVVIFKSEEDHEFKQCSLQQLLDQPSSIEPPPVYDPINHQLLTEEANVVGCCNGLICILINRKGFYLWNPATMISKELPKLERYPWRKFGFGWDGTSGAYKVFTLTRKGGIWKGNVYSSKTNSWKTVDRGSLYIYNNFGVFACGKIHWLMTTTQGFRYIEFFDLESDAVGRIELPFKPPPTYPCWQHYMVTEIGGFLHLACFYDQRSCVAVSVWVMKGSCWLKLATLSLIKFAFFAPNYLRYPQLFGGGPNGEILLMFGDNYLIYDSKNDWQLLGKGKTRTEFYNSHVYAQSLVSPNFPIAS